MGVGVGVGGESNDVKLRGVEMGGGDGSETGSVMEGEGNQKFRSSINASITLDFRKSENIPTVLLKLKHIPCSIW